MIGDSILPSSKENIVKMKLSWVDRVDHEVPAVVNAICEQKVGVFEHLKIKSKVDLYIRIKYTKRIMRGSVLKKYCPIGV